MVASKNPNTALAAHLDEAGMSHSGLAYRVAELAVRKGLTAPQFNHASVARWLRGEQPRGVTPELIAEVLSGLLGRRISREEIGMRPAKPAPDLGLIFAADLDAAIHAATELYGTDVHRRSILARSAYTAMAFVTPALRWLTAPASQLTERAGTRRVGEANVAAVRELTATFRRLDNQLGGGYARSTVVQYLNDEVTPMLKHGAYTEKTGAALFSAAAGMTLLAGWMAYDLEQHPIAQRYLIQALRLAQAGGDEALGGEILAAMSCQAAYLGDGMDAVDMARVAARAARRTGYGRLLSEALATEAQGHALAGDRAACASTLTQAHRALDGAGSDGPAWLEYFDGAYLSAKAGRALLDSGDSAGAVEAMRTSLHMRDGYERGHAFNLTVLGRALVENGDLDEGCVVAARAVAVARAVDSRRAQTELTTFGRRLARFRDTEPVKALTSSVPGLVTGS
jgi:hypothetical protein